MKAQFTDEQMIAMIKEQKSGEKTADECRRHGMSSATFYKYKSKYGGMEYSDEKKLRALEDENGKLKKLLAEQVLDVVRHPNTDSPTKVGVWVRHFGRYGLIDALLRNRIDIYP